MLLVPVGHASAFGEELTTPTGGTGATGDQSLLEDELHKYNKNQDVWFMLMLVAFLMMFIRKFEWGVALAVLLVTVTSFLAYMAVEEFFFDKAWNQDLMLMGVICSITVVIAIGMFLGTVKMAVLARRSHIRSDVRFYRVVHVHLSGRCCRPRWIDPGAHVRGVLRHGRYIDYQGEKSVP